MGSDDAAADVAARLERLLGGAVTGLERLSGGASRETWAFTAGGRDLVLRRDPPGRPGEHASMTLEAAVIHICAEAGLAVPAVVAVDDGETLGTAGIVMARVAGETLARHILREPALAGARAALTGQLAAFLAGLHRLPAAAVTGLDDTDPLVFLAGLYDTVEDCSPTFDVALRWLARHRPASAERAIVHGDFRLGNVVVAEDGLRAVLDWELVHFGDPLEDLAWLCVKAWRFGAAPEAAGVGTAGELLRAYEAAGGSPVDRLAFHWWLVEKTLQWGIICMKQAATHLSGAERSVELAAIGRRVAEQEWDMLELIAVEARPERATLPQPECEGPNAGLYGRPTAAELLDAAREFLLGPVGDATSGPVRFHARVTANVLAVVARELQQGPGAEARLRRNLDVIGVKDLAALSAAVRAGDFDDRQAELYPFLWTTVADRLAVANPRHLLEGN